MLRLSMLFSRHAIESWIKRMEKKIALKTIPIMNHRLDR